MALNFSSSALSKSLLTIGAFSVGSGLVTSEANASSTEPPKIDVSDQSISTKHEVRLTEKTQPFLRSLLSGNETLGKPEFSGKTKEKTLTRVLVSKNEVTTKPEFSFDQAKSTLTSTVVSQVKPSQKQVSWNKPTIDKLEKLALKLEGQSSNDPLSEAEAPVLVEKTNPVVNLSESTGINLCSDRSNCFSNIQFNGQLRSLYAQLPPQPAQTLSTPFPPPTSSSSFLPPPPSNNSVGLPVNYPTNFPTSYPTSFYPGFPITYPPGIASIYPIPFPGYGINVFPGVPSNYPIYPINYPIGVVTNPSYYPNSALASAPTVPTYSASGVLTRVPVPINPVTYPSGVSPGYFPGLANYPGFYPGYWNPIPGYSVNYPASYFPGYPVTPFPAFANSPVAPVAGYSPSIPVYPPPSAMAGYQPYSGALPGIPPAGSTSYPGYPVNPLLGSPPTYPVKPAVTVSTPQAQAIAPSPPETSPRKPLLQSSSLSGPSFQVQGVYVYQGSQSSARGRLTGVYPVTPNLLFGGTFDVTTGNAFADTPNQGFSVNELYLAASFQGAPGLRFAVGQLDLTSYFDRNSFAKDGATQFFNTIFQTNPALSATGIGSRPGLLANWRLNDTIEAKAAIFSSSQSISEFALNGFAGEVGFRFGNAIIRGTYVTDWDSGTDAREEAFGVNAEAYIPSIRMGLFARYGIQNNFRNGSNADSYSFGLNFLDLLMPGDRLGLAYGQGLSNEGLGRSSGVPTANALELFYDFRVLPNLRLGFSVQQVDNFSETIAGVRVRTDFDIFPSRN